MQFYGKLGDRENVFLIPDGDLKLELDRNCNLILGIVNTDSVLNYMGSDSTTLHINMKFISVQRISARHVNCSSLISRI